MRSFSLISGYSETSRLSGMRTCHRVNSEVWEFPEIWETFSLGEVREVRRSERRKVRNRRSRSKVSTV